MSPLMKAINRIAGIGLVITIPSQIIYGLTEHLLPLIILYLVPTSCLWLIIVLSSAKEISVGEENEQK